MSDYKKVLRADSVFKFRAIGDCVEGELNQLRKNEPSKFGTNDQYIIKTSSGVVKVYSSGLLRQMISKSMVGMKIKITYIGDVETEKGEAKDFEVLFKEMEQ